MPWPQIIDICGLGFEPNRVSSVIHYIFVISVNIHGTHCSNHASLIRATPRAVFMSPSSSASIVSHALVVSCCVGMFSRILFPVLCCTPPYLDLYFDTLYIITMHVKFKILGAY